MARHISSRLKITGELVAETPLHVGGYGESFETDMALARNGKDEFYIPGTGLTGALRGWFEKNFPDEARDLWGYQEGDNGHASFVLIEDLTLPRQVQSELRDGVGIDRFYGTAADKAKFDRAILPKGTRLKLEITVDMQEGANQVKAMFERLLGALQNGHIRLGASKTRGLGKVKCGPIGIEEYSLFDPEGILNAVEKKPTKKYQIQNLKAAGLTGSELLTITIKWQPKSAVMVKAGYEGIGVDMLPLTSGNGKDKVSLCLPGSSIKGAFRAQAERILRTVFDIDATRNPNDPQNFSKQLRLLDKDGKETKATKLLGVLFGAKKERDESSKSTSTLGLGALSIDDCYFDKQIEVADWQSVETGKTTKTVNGKEEDVTYTEQGLWQALKTIEGSADLISPTREFAISHHVAIDRWTGGAAAGALYSVLQPTAKIGWEDICLTLDFSRLRKADGSPDEALRKKCVMLLLLILRDFAENHLPLGFATNRGMGEVTDVSFAAHGSYEFEWKDGKFDFKNNANLKSELEKEWAEWLKKN